MNAIDFNRLCLHCMREGVTNGVCSFCKKAAVSDQSPPHALPKQTILHGKYMVGAALGYGGFGITYAALDLKDNHRVAIKEYMPSAFSTRKPGETVINCNSTPEDYVYGKQLFLKEAQTIHTLRGNKNIIQVEKLFEENNSAYYAMEFLDGCDLKAYLAKRGEKLPFAETVRLLLPLLKALEQVHAKGVIHRDISPDNIYMCNDGTVKLIDFGAAHAALDERSKSIDVIIKRGYAPIEQYSRRGKQGPWTDIYALGCTLYRCITGCVPEESTQRSANDKTLMPSRLGIAITQAQERVLMRAIAVRKEDRYATAREFREALENVLGTKSGAQSGSPQAYAVPGANSGKVEGERKMNGVVKATFGRRLGAYLLDNVICAMILYFMIYLIGFVAGPILAYIITAAISALLENGSWHASIGNRVAGLKVISLKPGPLDASQCFMRNAIKYLPYLFVGLGYLSYFTYVLGGLISLALVIMPFTNELGQSLHCKLSNTMVVLSGISQAAEHVQVNNAARSAVGIRGMSGVHTGNVFPIGTAVVRMGRDPASCAIVFPDSARGVSSRHCQLVYNPQFGSITLTDIGSSYGTRLADGTVLMAQASRQLGVGDVFTIGSETFVVVSM